MRALLLGAAALLLGLRPAAPAAPAPPPNVLFLFADDLRADAVAALGHSVVQTPHLDRLVRRGLTFHRAYLQGGRNAATCVPSRAMLLSGRSLFDIDETLQRHPTWPESFAAAGYTTFISGKWHNGDASLARSFQIARSVFTGGMTNPLQAPLRDLENGQLSPPKISPQHACATFADETIRFLNQPQAQPFFAYLPFDAPHDPHIVPPDFPVHYPPSAIPLPPNFLPQHPWDNGEMTIRDELLLPWPRSPDGVRALLADYYRYISYLDSQIGRVLDALAASPHAAHTLIVFSADSGVARGSHGLIGKQNLYEHSLRVPLVIAGPGIPEGQSTEALCYLFDLLPTLGKLCGVPGPATSQGLEFTATLRRPAQPARPHLRFAYKDAQRAYTDGRYKLIRYPKIDRSQLFDLSADPYEITNLAAQPAHAATLASLTLQMQQEMLRSGDACPLQVPRPTPADWTPPPHP